MTLHELIFSDSRRLKFSRHIIFWLCWWVFASCIWLRNVSPEEAGMKNFIIYQFAVTFNRLMLQIIFAYFFIYFLIPRFLFKKKNSQFIIAFILFLFFFSIATYLQYGAPTTFGRQLAHQKQLSLFLRIYYIPFSQINFTGTLVSCTLILVVKYYKNWFKKQQENELLLQENAQAEMQLLKAQVHPHFLFNTLNNIYALTLDDSPKAAVIVKKLSGMMHYMNTDGSQQLVALTNEIKMLTDYIGLEKIRYGERLKLQVNIQIAPEENKMIAPLLLIPFIENCFKHGASKLIDTAWIHLHVEARDNFLFFNISNNKPCDAAIKETRTKIGLTNVQKRLQLLYPGKHDLEIDSSENSFSVHLKLLLQPPLNSPKKEQQVSTFQKAFYVS